MEVLKTFLKNFIRELNVNRLMKEIMKDERLKAYVIELNQEQLYEQGADSKGNQLEPYTFATMNIKRKKGQVYNRTTLKDTGKFYKSFRIIVQSDGFIIQANGQKEEMNLFDRYGIDILGLNEVNMYQFQQILAREIRTKIIQAISIN
jgi:hypothetical protein